MCNMMWQTGEQEQVGFKDALRQFIESPNSIQQTNAAKLNKMIGNKAKKRKKTGKNGRDY